MNTVRPFIVVVLLSVTDLTLSAADDPPGWGTISNETGRPIAITFRTERGNLLERQVAPSQSIDLRSSAHYRVSLRGSERTFDIDAAPPKDRMLAAMLDVDVSRRHDMFLTPWQLRYHYVIDQGGRTVIRAGVSLSVVERFQREYLARMQERGFDGKANEDDNELSAAPRLGLREDESRTTLQDIYRIAREQTLEELFEKYLNTTPRAWKGFFIQGWRRDFTLPAVSPSANQPLEPTEETQGGSRFHVLVHLHSSPSDEVEQFCYDVLSGSLGLRRDDLIIYFEPLKFAGHIAIYKLADEFYPDGRLSLRLVRNAVLRVLEPYSEFSDSELASQPAQVSITSRWQYNIETTPASFKNASVRWRIIVNCSVDEAEYPGAPEGIRLQVRLVVETKARGADISRFRPLTEFDGFAVSLVGSPAHEALPDIPAIARAAPPRQRLSLEKFAGTLQKELVGRLSGLPP
jgi:hypothetical protein